MLLLYQRPNELLFGSFCINTTQILHVFVSMLAFNCMPIAQSKVAKAFWKHPLWISAGAAYALYSVHVLHNFWEKTFYT